MTKINKLSEIVNEVERMVKIYKRVENDYQREAYSQYVDLVIEQTDFSFEEKSNLREYWRNLLR